MSPNLGQNHDVPYGFIDFSANSPVVATVRDLLHDILYGNTDCTMHDMQSNIAEAGTVCLPGRQFGTDLSSFFAAFARVVDINEAHRQPNVLQSLR